MSESPERFLFGPRDRRGLIAGVRTGQLVVVGVGLAGALVTSHVVRAPARAPISIACVIISIAVVTWPIAGRTVEEWVPVALGYSTRSLAGANRSVVGVEMSARRTDRPSIFDGIEIASIEMSNGRQIGALLDRRSAAASALVELGGESFALLSESERTRRIDGWAGVLAGVTRRAGELYRLQWIERTVPDTADGLRRHLEARLDATDGGTGARSAVHSYEELVTREPPATLVHECFVAISVRTPNGRVLRSQGGEPVEGAWRGRLLSQVVLLAERCRHAGMPVRGLVSPEGLETAIRRSFDPLGPMTKSGIPWPVGVETVWGAMRTDGQWHTTFWVAEWPRHEVGSDFLLPLLIGVRARRTVSLVMAPVPAARAVKRAEHARTSRLADAELRRRHGFADTARARSEDESVLRREAELAAGHGAFRYSAYVTVSAPDREALERSCREVVNAAALCGLDLRRLYGDQATAFCFTLPTGRGCT
jgi:hypothetical protein